MQALLFVMMIYCGESGESSTSAAAAVEAVDSDFREAASEAEAERKWT